MGTVNKQPGQSLGPALGELGIDPTLTGGAYADPRDLPVFVIKETRDLRAEYLAGGVREADIPKTLPLVSGRITTKRQSELEREFYKRDPKDVAALQHRLYAGGFYAQGVDADEIALGDYDEYTFAAYSKAIARAASFYAAGREITVDDVIDMAGGIEGAEGRGRAAGRTRQPLVTELTNPEDLRYYAQKTAVSTLGRALRPDELERFVTSFHGAQSTAQAAAYGAGVAGGTAVAAPSAATAAEAFARREAPVEAGAHDVVRVFDVFSKMIGRRS